MKREKRQNVNKTLIYRDRCFSPNSVNQHTKKYLLVFLFTILSYYCYNYYFIFVVVTIAVAVAFVGVVDLKLFCSCVRWK